MKKVKFEELRKKCVRGSANCVDKTNAMPGAKNNCRPDYCPKMRGDKPDAYRQGIIASTKPSAENPYPRGTRAGERWDAGVVTGKSEIVVHKAWVLANHDIPPRPPCGGAWYVLRLAMGIVGRDRCVKGVPTRMLRLRLPPFTLVATGRDAAKAEIAEKIDELFDAFDESGSTQKKDKRK